MELKNFFAQDNEGTKLSGASCYVYMRGTETLAPGVVKANGVSLNSPFFSDDNGLVQFAAPNGLYDVRVVSGARDYRLPIQFNDVGDNLASAEEAARRAETARDSAHLSAGLKDSIAEGLRSTVSGQNFSVLSELRPSFIQVYKNVEGVEVPLTDYPSGDALREVTGVVRTAVGTLATREYVSASDGEGGMAMRLTDDAFETLPFDARRVPGGTYIGDSEGALDLYTSEKIVQIGFVEFRHTSQPGFFVTDAEDQVIPGYEDNGDDTDTDTPVDPLTTGVLFTPKVCTAAAFPSTIYAANMIGRRDLAGDLVMSIGSQVGAVSKTGPAIEVKADEWGESAVLNLRKPGDFDNRKIMQLSLINVPQQAERTLKVLLIADSIGANQGSYLLDIYLRQMGFNPTFIGTLNGQGANSSTDGPLGEARSGWQTSDYTYAITETATVIVPGEEAAYLAMSAVNKRSRNPFLRAAVAGDPTNLVRNGYVFDPAFYQSRFGLETPDVVVYAMGTNDANFQLPGSVYDIVLDNDRIALSQISATWPAAKIIRTIPTTPRNSVRDALWTASYVPVIRAMKQAVENQANTRITVAPLWAMSNPEVGYPIRTLPVDSDGFISAPWTGSIHPEGNGRHAYYKAMAPFVGAANLNLI